MTSQLFRISPSEAVELKSATVAIEKTLQTLMERHLDVFLGVQLLASEGMTGKVHGGRIDSLGVD